MASPPERIPWWQAYKTLGCYYPGYNYKIHGPFDPAKNYSFNDVHWTKLKIRDIGSWLKRRDFSPHGISHTFGRYWWRLYVNHTYPLKSGANIIFTAMFIGMAANAVLLYPKYLKHHKLRKYHW